jgi:diguanylate cyclase (GGDEF)-like protein
MEEEIKHRAYHDNLTNLPNRAFFKEVLSIEIANARRNNKKLAILFLDLDRFKEINDAMGHAAGDQMLVEIADRLTKCIRRSDIVARIGGDEFNILLSGAENARDMSAIARKILLELREPYIIGGREWPLGVTGSIGISIYPDDSEDVDTLFKYADKAMYYAKSIGRNDFQFYSPTMNTEPVKQVQLEDELRQALDRGELRVYYQPLVDTASGKIVCAEALLRWQHPKLGLLEPDQFIVLAEKTGLLIPIGEWLIREACMKNVQWQMAGYEPICIAANLSDRQVHSPGLVEMTMQAVRAGGLNPRWLELEITENTLIHDPELIIQKLGKLSEYGIGLTMDDFGTGYSSLRYLKQLPIQKIKIDKSFIKDIITDPNDKAIVNAVIAMTHNLSLRVVAEGVETEEQLLFLRSRKCDEIQGDLISKAISADDFEKLLAARTANIKFDGFPKVRHSA